jgi:hypothetical protein
MTTFEYFNKGNNTEQSEEHLYEERKRIHSHNGKRSLNYSSFKPDKKVTTCHLLK